jgi:hypothetical protein
MMPCKCVKAVFKRGRVCVTSGAGSNITHSLKAQDVIDRSKESDIYIEGNCCRAVLDTGAMVSSIAYKSHQSLLPHFQINLFKDFKLHVTGAGDRALPYMGYIEVDVSVPDIGLESVICILLVAPDTQYTESVPVILGTHVLNRLQRQLESNHGVQFQQKI